MSDEYEDTYTASDYWEDMYEETMLHVSIFETPREEAQRIFEARSGGFIRYQKRAF